MKKDYYNIVEFQKTRPKDESMEESLYFYVIKLSMMPKHKNTLMSILPYDYSLQFDDLVTELYIRALIYKDKDKDYPYSIFSFTFDLNKLCRHYKNTKKGLYENITMKEYHEPINLDTYSFVFDDLISSLNEDDKKIVTMYVVNKYTLKEISENIPILNSSASVKYRLEQIFKKLRDTL